MYGRRSSLPDGPEDHVDGRVHVQAFLRQKRHPVERRTDLTPLPQQELQLLRIKFSYLVFQTSECCLLFFDLLRQLNHFPLSNFEAGDEACHLQQDKTSREACSLTDHSNYPPSTYRFTHNSTLPTVYSSFHMPPLNIPTTSSCNTDFHSPYFSYLQTTAYPYYKNTCSRGTGLDTSLQHKFLSQSPSEACKEGHKDEVNAKRLEVDLAPPPLEGGYSDALLGDSGAAKLPAVSLNRWNSCNQDSFFFKPLQHHDDHQWNNCTFQTRDSQLLDLEKPSESSGGVKRESCIYLPCPSNLSFGDCVSGDKMTNVDGLVTTLDLNIK